MRKHILILLLLVCCALKVPYATAFENKQTHPAITKHAVDRSVLADGYLNEQLGLEDNLSTVLELTDDFKDRINMRVSQQPGFNWNKSSISIRDWLVEGSSLEDVPNPRARHHFHDPIRDDGLNNMNGPGWLMDLLYFGSGYTYPAYSEFTAAGISALDTARGTHFWTEPSPVYRNWCDWPRARELFDFALASPSKDDRRKNLGSMFITLGHICHLLEDMGVPAHTRNDFIWGHLVAGFHKNITGAKDPWYKGGHPFEAWMEEQIINDGNEIPSIYLNRLMDSPPAFSKLEHYWDTGICLESGIPQWQGDSPGWPGTGFGNPPPEKSWGLAECTNYQFLSYSTMFKNSGLQSFPHPAKAHTRLDWYSIDGKKKYYRIGYEVPHLARSTFTAYMANAAGVSLSLMPDTPEDRKVYEDYAKRTIPRTVDYTTGLINYFFRGRLSVEPNCAGPDCAQIEVYIINDSNNSDAPQTLKGGTFGLYWDDEEETRAEISGFNVPGWDSASTLNYGQSVTGQFTKPTPSSEHQISKYILVYKGQINANPAEPDPDDPDAIAVDIFGPPEPPPHIENITPDMGHPGSVLLIEGSGLSSTPAENTVSFEDTNGIYPDVHGVVVEADVNETWIKVELPYFDACDVDYYWVHTQVTVDGNPSNTYDFRLTNYVWCTIKLWDAGESVDDEFDLYVNDEYITTSYMDPPEDPTIADIGFWYVDEYHFVDIYLYDSYEEPGGTLGIIVEPYVNRVVAYRWDSTSEMQEFLYDNMYSGLFADYFGSDLLEVPDDGIELDVYAQATYSSSALAFPNSTEIWEKAKAVAANGESIGEFDSFTTTLKIYKPAKIHRKSAGRVQPRIRTKTRKR